MSRTLQTPQPKQQKRRHVHISYKENPESNKALDGIISYDIIIKINQKSIKINQKSIKN